MTQSEIDAAYDGLRDAVQAYVDSHAPSTDQLVTDFVVIGVARDVSDEDHAGFFGMVNSVEGIPRKAIIELLCQGIMQFTDGEVQEFAG